MDLEAVRLSFRPSVTFSGSSQCRLMSGVSADALLVTCSVGADGGIVECTGVNSNLL